MLIIISYLISILISAYFCYEVITEAPETWEIAAGESLWLLLNATIITLVIVSSTGMTREVS